MKYTKESLQKTWGLVESKDHADYISEQCKSVGIISSDTWRCEYGYFSISLNELLFWSDESHANSKGKKQITIPLPPKAKAEKPDLSKLPIHFDCVCNKCGGKCCIGNCDEWPKTPGDKLRDKSSDIPQNEKRNKSKQAYEILKSLDYDYDLDKQKWFKKEYM